MSKDPASDPTSPITPATGAGDPASVTAGVQPAGRRKRKSSFFADIMRVSTGAFMHVGVMLIIGWLMIRVWGAEARGWVAVVMNIPGMLCVATELGLKKVLPYMIGQQIETTQRVVSVGLSIWLASVTFAMAIALAYFLVIGVEGPPLYWGLLAVVVILPTQLLNLLKAIALGVEEIGYFNKFRYVRDLVNLGVLLIFMFALRLDREWAWAQILAAILGATTVCVLGGRMLLHYVKIRLDWDFDLVKRILFRGVVFSLGSVLMQFNYKIDIFILGLFLGRPDPPVTASDIANYTVGVAFANFLWQIPIVMGTVLFSRSVNAKDKHAMAQRTSRMVRLGTVLAIPPGVALFVVSPWLLPFIYGHEIDQADDVIRILLPGILAFFAARMMEADLTGKGMPWRVVSVMGPVVLANIVLNMVFIPSMGIQGAALTSTITYSLGSLAMIVVYSNATGLTLAEIIVPRRSDFALKVGKRRPKQSSEDIGPADDDADQA